MTLLMSCGAIKIKSTKSETPKGHSINCVLVLSLFISAVNSNSGKYIATQTSITIHWEEKTRLKNYLILIRVSAKKKKRFILNRVKTKTSDLKSSIT